MPMRKGYADKVFIITSGESMSVYAAANIAMAVENFKSRGYASLGGFILNKRNVKNEEEKDKMSDVVCEVIAQLPTKYGTFEAHGYVDQRSGEHHVALVKGDIADGTSFMPCAF